jgi:hypothetical protein
MSINGVLFSDGRKPQLIASELVHFTVEKTTQLNLDRPQSAAGTGLDHFVVTSGTVYLTNIRFIYITDISVRGAILESFVVPLENVRDAKLNQPWFGAMSFECLVLPCPGGGLPAPSNLQLTFPEGGGADFFRVLSSVTQALAEARNPAILPSYEALPSHLSDQAIRDIRSSEPTNVQGNFLPSYDVALTHQSSPSRQVTEQETEEWILLNNIPSGTSR